MLKHVSFLTTDLARTLAFYAALGGQLEKQQVTGEGDRRAVLRLGDGRLQFFQIEGEAPAPHAHWAEHVALHVRGLPDRLRELQGQGVPVTRGLQLSPGGRLMAFVMDPDGRQVELLDSDPASASAASAAG